MDEIVGVICTGIGGTVTAHTRPFVHAILQADHIHIYQSCHKEGLFQGH